MYGQSPRNRDAHSSGCPSNSSSVRTNTAQRGESLMPTSTKVVNQLANTVTKRLTNTGGRATLDALINDVTNTSGELRMLVRHAARKAILNGAIVRVRHAREASQDTVIEMSAWKKAARRRTDEDQREDPAETPPDSGRPAARGPKKTRHGQETIKSPGTRPRGRNSDELRHLLPAEPPRRCVKPRSRRSNARSAPQGIAR